MRGEYDLYQPKDDAEGEHLEFKCHCCPDADCETDTIASRGTSGIDVSNISGAGCDLDTGSIGPFRVRIPKEHL